MPVTNGGALKCPAACYADEMPMPGSAPDNMSYGAVRIPPPRRSLAGVSAIGRQPLRHCGSRLACRGSILKPSIADVAEPSINGVIDAYFTSNLVAYRITGRTEINKRHYCRSIENISPACRTDAVSASILRWHSRLTFLLWAPALTSLPRGVNQLSWQASAWNSSMPVRRYYCAWSPHSSAAQKSEYFDWLRICRFASPTVNALFDANASRAHANVDIDASTSAAHQS